MDVEKNPYSDIIHLPHHKAANRPHMSMHDRAAQFSPFATLTGFEGIIAETSRLTNRRIVLSENEKLLLDQKLALISAMLREKKHPEISVVYFVPDRLKEGGEYEEFTGFVRKVNPIERTVVFRSSREGSASKTLHIDDIKDIHGKLVDFMDEE